MEYDSYFEINENLFENDLTDIFNDGPIYEQEELEESSRSLAILSGLGGLYTLGPVSTHYDLQKEKAARQALAQLKGDSAGVYDANNIGSDMLHNIGASIPIVGSVVANHAYDRRIKAEEELRKALGMTASEIEQEKPILKKK